MEVSIHLKGKEVGKVAANNIKVDYQEEKISNGNSIILTYIKSKTIYALMEDIKFNEFLKLDITFFDNYFDFVTDVLRLPKSMKLPKKKRLRNKIKKKYTYKMIVNNCRIRLN